MGRPVVTDEQPSFAGGLNSTGSYATMKPDQSRQLQNIRLSTYGDATKRLGTKRLHATAMNSGAQIWGGFQYRPSGATITELAQAGTTLYGSTDHGATWTAITGTLGVTQATSFAQFVNATGAEVTYLSDGTGYFSTTGSGALSTVIKPTTTIARVTRIWVYNSRLYGCDGQNQFLFASDLNNGDTLGITASSGIIATIRTYGAQSVIGGCALGASNIIFHTKAISRWTGTSIDDIAVETGAQGLSGSVGTIAPGSIVTVDGIEAASPFLHAGAAFFISERGAYLVTEYSVQPLDKPDQPDPLIPLVSVMAQSTLATTVGVHDRVAKAVRWMIPGLGIYSYNYVLGAWEGPDVGVHTTAGTKTTALWNSTDANDVPTVICGGVDGFARRLDTPSVLKDDVLSDGTLGSAVTSIVQLRRLFGDDPASDKANRYGFLLGNLNNSANTVASWATANDTGSFTIPANASEQTLKIQLSGRGPWTDVTFTDSSGTARPSYSRYTHVSFNMGLRGA